MNVSILRKIEAEIARLKYLYLATLYSYGQSMKTITRNLRSGELQPHTPIVLEQKDKEGQPLFNNPYAFLHKINSQFPQYLRETIFVRLISALEVFLIDIVRDMFIARRDLFYSEQKIEFSFGEMLSAESITDLWTKLINRELRKLQNQGFKEIVKFYKNRFSIDLNSSSIPLASIQEYHDRRHILVHRLGKADDEYRHRYNSTLKLLPVNEEYLLSSLDSILNFAKFVTVAAQTKIDEGRTTIEPQRTEIEIRIVVEAISDAAKAVTDRGFHYSIEDKIGCLGDILVSYQIEEPKQILFLAGNRANVGAYIKILKKLERKNALVIHERETFRRQSTHHHKCRLPIETIKSIAQSLPNRPWFRNIHKEIANRFGISNKQAYAAIDVILGDENLASMIATNEQGIGDLNENKNE